MNLRPSGYEPEELPRARSRFASADHHRRQTVPKRPVSRKLANPVSREGALALVADLRSAAFPERRSTIRRRQWGHAGRGRSRRPGPRRSRSCGQRWNRPHGRRYRQARRRSCVEPIGDTDEGDGAGCPRHYANAGIHVLVDAILPIGSFVGKRPRSANDEHEETDAVGIAE